MLSNIVLVISLLFFLVEGAKYKVVSNNLRSKLSKEDKIKAVTQLKEHIASVTGKGKASKKDSSVLKRIQEAKQVETWYDYDTSFSSYMWTNANLYQVAGCSGTVVSQSNTYESFCTVGTFTGSNGETYNSAQELFMSDCSSKVAAFFSNADCTGTPAQQGNTVLTGLTSNGKCTEMTGDDDGGFNFLSGNVFCTSSAMAFSGDALSMTEYEQTTTCSGDASQILRIGGGCYETSATSSIAYAAGPTISMFGTTDCSGTAITITSSGCTTDDDDYDDDYDDLYDDDNLFDDAQFTYAEFDTNTSSVFAWSGSSMGAVLNYSLSAALVLMSCTLFF